MDFLKLIIFGAIGSILGVGIIYIFKNINKYVVKKYSNKLKINFNKFYKNEPMESKIIYLLEIVSVFIISLITGMTALIALLFIISLITGMTALIALLFITLIMCSVLLILPFLIYMVYPNNETFATFYSTNTFLSIEIFTNISGIILGMVSSIVFFSAIQLINSYLKFKIIQKEK